jgi:hypothetical protein
MHSESTHSVTGCVALYVVTCGAGVRTGHEDMLGNVAHPACI